MRGRIKAALRAWFVSQGFIEVETACLQVSPGNETHLHAFATELVRTDLSRRDLYLHTSPEFAMKKLLAAGETKIFTFAPVFRNRERGALHAPEFTMLEWYRADTPYEALWDDCAAIVRIAAETSGHAPWAFRGKVCDPLKPLGRRTVEDAFAAAGIGLGETLTETSVDRDALAARVRDAGIQVGKQDSWSDIFSRVIVEKVEPKLGLIRARYSVSLSGERGGARPARPPRPEMGRTLRTLRVRRRTRQRLRGIDRRRRAAPPF